MGAFLGHEHSACDRTGSFDARWASLGFGYQYHQTAFYHQCRLTMGIAVDERRGTVYVTSGSSVSVINEDTDKVTAVIPVAGLGLRLRSILTVARSTQRATPGKLFRSSMKRPTAVTKTISLALRQHACGSGRPYRGKAYVGMRQPCRSGTCQRLETAGI